MIGNLENQVMFNSPHLSPLPSSRSFLLSTVASIPSTYHLPLKQSKQQFLRGVTRHSVLAVALSWIFLFSENTFRAIEVSIVCCLCLQCSGNPLVVITHSKREPDCCHHLHLVMHWARVSSRHRICLSAFGGPEDGADSCLGGAYNTSNDPFHMHSVVQLQTIAYTQH